MRRAGEMQSHLRRWYITKTAYARPEQFITTKYGDKRPLQQPAALVSASARYTSKYPSLNDKMKFTYWILSTYSISLLSCAEIKVLPAAKILTNDPIKCPKDNSIPVCGTNGIENLLFGNECVLKEAGQKRGDFTATTLKTCFKDCELICLGFYDPTCVIDPATNNTRTFNNKCEIVKNACRTDIDWKFKMKGECTNTLKRVKRIKVKNGSRKSKRRKLKPIPCPKIFNPVCAIFTGVKSTFINECMVNAENVLTGKDWKIFSQGICEEDYLSVSKSPKIRGVKKRSLNLKTFENFENAFELGEPVNYIRTPPIFHTQYIKTEDPVKFFNSAQSDFSSFYGSQPEIQPEFIGKPENMILEEYFKNADNEELLPDLLRQNSELNSQPLIEDFGFKEIFKNVESSETLNFDQNPYQIDSPKSNYKPIKVENCKLGTSQLCCSFQQKTRTFNNICELNLHNELTGEEWQLEHEGICKDCTYVCPKTFEPICVSMNGLQYTIGNECILNANICKHKNRTWHIIKKGICDEDAEKQYQHIKDKYETVTPGFRFKSDYRKLESTSTKPIQTVTTNSKLESYVSIENPLKPLQIQETKNSCPKKFNLKDATTNSFKDMENLKARDSESLPTTPKISECETNNPLDSENIRDDRFSIYGLHKNSVMISLIKALDESRATINV